MKNIVKFILFIIYTISIFFINDLRLLGCLFLLNYIIAILFRINLKSMFYNLKILFPFIMITAIINVLLSSLYDGIIMGIRIIICYNITYIFSKTLTVFEISDTIKKLFYPLKLFKVNVDNIGIIISIAICMIPVLKNEISTLMQTMKSKGRPIKITNIIIIMKQMLISIFRKTDQMEKALIAKAYMEQ